jgi:DNA-binding transcriptional regulator YhcF (GntR family)
VEELRLLSLEADSLLSVRELASKLSVSTATVYGL